jgi:hypothetical protein
MAGAVTRQPARAVPAVSRRGDPPRPPDRGDPPRPPDRGDPPRPRRRLRWGGLVVLLLGLAGVAAILVAREDGQDIAWSKWLVAALAPGFAELPPWAPAAIRDLAALGGPAPLAALAAAIFLAAMFRDGLGPAIGVPLLLGAAAAGVLLLKSLFLLPGSPPPRLDLALLEQPFPSALALFAGLLWAWLFRMLRAGPAMTALGWLLGAAVAAARVGLGLHAPAEVAAGLAAALVVLGFLGMVAPVEKDRR